ncbi:MAG TPA: glycoside hydrolase family 16 protein [Chthoniobacteraceae bacterium]|nr:glycoside hydrolase family 16 protein [Chthoniobacteraceae bacterium]
MHTRTPRTLLAVLACGIALCAFLFHAFAAQPEYELSQATAVDVGGQSVQLPAGQAVAPLGSLTPDQSGNIMVRITLPNGSVTMAQIPAANIRVKGSGDVAAPAMTAGGVPPAGAPPAAAGAPPASAPAPAISAPAPAVTQAPATTTQPAPASNVGGSDAIAKYNTEGGGGGGEHTNWKLVWEDDFSKDGGQIDQKKWGLINKGGGFGNNEAEFYSNSPKNAHIENGELVMTAYKDDAGKKYTSAKLTTEGKYDVLYGRIEACIKVPKAQLGNWPAFWMMPTASKYGGWPNSGEIDIMEVINMEDKLYGTDHFGTGSKQAGAQIAAPGGDFSKDYHVYGVEWEPQKFTWFLDHKSYGSLTKWGTGKAPYPAPFDQKFYIILNYALGGNWPNNVVSPKRNLPDADAVFPQSMYVKYVRVYQP